jgi:hypothetical protein
VRDRGTSLQDFSSSRRLSQSSRGGVYLNCGSP